MCVCHTCKSKDHLAQCALHPRQVDSLSPSGMHGGQLRHKKDPTEDPHGTHKAGDKTSRWATNAARKWGWKSREDSKTLGRQHNETHGIVSWAYFPIVMISCYLHLPIACKLFPEPEQNTRPSWVELRSGSYSRDVHLIDVVWNHSD